MMKKILTVTLGSFLFLIICSAVAYISGKLPDLNGWIYLIIGISILAVSGIITVFAKENIALNIVCSALSAVALGFCIRAWYVLRALENDFYVMVLVSLAAALYLWLYFLLSKIPVFEEHIMIFTMLFLVISVGVYIPAVIFTETTFLSTLGYYMLIELAFVYAVFANAEGKRSLLRDFTLSTYSVFGIAVLIAVIAALCLADGDLDCGDCCDITDCCDIGMEKRKKNRVKK